MLEWVAIPFSRGSPQPGSPSLQADSLPSEPPGYLQINGSKESEIGKDGKQMDNDVSSCGPLIPKLKETKLVTLQIHVLSKAR